jgi:hypothetical protein
VTRYPVIFAGRNTHVAIVETRGLPEGEAEANCALITAAPDMASACRRALALIGPDGSKEIAEWEATIEALESALRKAGADV